VVPAAVHGLRVWRRLAERVVRQMYRVATEVALAPER
jgi:hypothetical protein